MNKINIIFHHISPWGKFSGSGFHNRSGNVFKQLWSHAAINKILFVHASDFWMITSDKKKRKKILWR